MTCLDYEVSSTWRVMVITALVRSTREGNVLTRVCLSVHGGGYPHPIMLCNISQNAMGQLGGGGSLPGPARGVPCQVQPGGYPAGGVPCQGGYPGWGVPWLGGYPGRGGTLAGGYPGRGGTLDGGYPGWGVPWPGGYPGWEGGVPWPGGTLTGKGVPWLGGYPVRTT